MVILAGLLPSAAEAQTFVRNFSIRYTADINGDIAQVGNTIMTCQAATNSTDAGGVSCAAAQAGSQQRNNGYNMVNVDVDGDPTTFNSSSADLGMPAGSTVRWAGLYWGARSANAARGQMLFRTPGGSYQPISAQQLDDGNALTANFYAGFADVTSLVQFAGNGTYWGANIQTTAGGNQWGGWALIVVYENNAQTLKNLVIYDGLALVNTALPQGITLNFTGFRTPLSGPVITRVGSVGYDGDAGPDGGSTGDTLQMYSSTNPTPTTISDANNPGSNYYNSTISDLGISVTTRNPAYLNTLGFDLDRFNVPAGVVGNNATSATMNLGTAGEFYYPHVTTFATELYVPVITPNLVKTATDLNGGSLLPGDILRWTISMSNTGLDGGVNLILRDGINPNTTYVPGSLRINSGANTGLKTDGAGDDQAESSSSAAACNPAPVPCVIFRLGTGANAVTGGSLAFGEATSLSFDVTVNGAVSAGTQISNTAYISYNGQTLATTAFAASSAATTATVLAPPTIAKSFAPAVVNTNVDSVLSIVVSNPAGNPTALTGVTFSDSYLSPTVTTLVNSPTPAPAISCTPGSTPGTLTGGVAGGTSIGMSPGATIQPGGSCTITVNVRSASAGLQTNTTSAVSSTNGGSSAAGASATLSVGRPSIVKSFTKSEIEGSTGAPLANRQAIMRFAITNPTGAAISGLTFTDTWNGAGFSAPTGVTTSASVLGLACPGVNALNISAANSLSYNSGAATLAAGATCYIDVTISGLAQGSYTNTTGAIGSSIGAGTVSNTVSITVVGPPTVTKTFNPSIINSGDISQLRIVFANPNATTTLTRANGAGNVVVDSYPGGVGMANTTPRSVTLNCTAGSSATLGACAAGVGSCAIDAMTLAPGGSCTLNTNVTATATGANNLPVVTFDNAPDPDPGPVTLTVTALGEPTTTKSFRDPANLANVITTLAVNGVSRMRIRITNPNAGGALTGVSFTDTYPPGLVNTSTPNPTIAAVAGTCTLGTVSATAGANMLALSGLSISPSGQCDILVSVTSATPGIYTNNTGPITTTNSPPGNAAAATITYLNPPTVTKSFNPTFIAPGGTSTLTIVVANPPTNSAALTGVGVVDVLPLVPAAMTIASGVTASTCTAGSTAGTLRDQGDSATFAAGDTAIRYGQTTGGGTQATLLVNGSCTFTVQVTAAVAGNYTNTTNAVTSANGGTGLTASATLAVGKIGIAKAFSPATINVGDTSTLTFTLTNPIAAPVTGIAFTDNLVNMTVANATVGGTCAGVTSNAGSGVTNFQVTGGNIPASSSCTITISVTSSVSGNHNNTTSGVTRSGDAVAGNPSNTAVLTVRPPPVVTKFFLTPEIGINGVSRARIRLFNGDAANITGVGFTDTFPSGVVTASPSVVTNTCGGTLTSTTTSLTLAGGTITGNSVCDIEVNVTGSVAGTYVNDIPAGAVASSYGANQLAAQATLRILAPIAVTKAFSPTAVATGGTSVLTITLTNPNSTAVTGAAFTDPYPANLVNAAAPGATTTCAGGTLTAAPAGTNLVLSGATVPASGSCFVAVNVTSAVAGTYNNGGFAVTTTNAGSTTAGSAQLGVGRPSITKSFSPNPIGAGGISTLTLTIANPTNAAISAVNVLDAFPAGMVVANPLITFNSCGGTLDEADAVDGDNTLEPADASVRLTGGTIAANGSCQIRVDVTTATAGVRTNTTGAVGSSLGAGNAASAVLTTLTPLTVLKSFAPASVGVNQNSVLTIRLTNPNAFAVSNAAFTDSYPTNLVNAPSPGGATTCTGGTVTATGGGTSVQLAGGTVPASSFCEVTVNVRSATAGAYNNDLPANSVTSSAGNSLASNTATLTVLAPPTVAKAFGAATTPRSTNVTMTITLTNPNTTAITGVSFTDAFPVGLVLTNNSFTNTCGGTIDENDAIDGDNTFETGDASVRLTSGTIPASGSCFVQVNVQSAIAGSYINSTGLVTTGNAGTAGPANANLYVMAPLQVSKSFTPTTFVVGAGSSTLSVVVTNPNPIAVTGLNITDSYDAGAGNMQNNTPAPVGTHSFNSCGGVLTATNDLAFFSLAGGSVPANGSCTIWVRVDSPTAATPSSNLNCITNTGPDVFGTTNAGVPTFPICATLAKVASGASALPPTISKTFTPSSVAPGAVSTLSFTIVNPSTANNLNNVNFTDTFPAGMVVATPPNATSTCTGTWTTTAGANNVAKGNFTLNANGAGTANCVVTVQVTAALAGIYNNISSVVGSSAGNGNQATAILTVLDQPTITKAFSPTSINQGGSSTITITLFNENTIALTGAVFSDPMVNMQVAAGATTNTCGGTLTATVGSGSISLSGGTIPARVGLVPGSCAITVPVTSVVAGVWPNSTTGVTTTQTPSAGPGSNAPTLTVNALTSLVSGFVYADANSNGVRQPSEDWTTGTIVYVNIVTGGVVVQSQAVTPGSGAFTFPAVPYGNYEIILAAAPASPTAIAPPGWFFTYPTNGRLGLNVTGALQPLYDFGLFGSGASRITGRVFRDTGGGTGTANDGILGTGEGLLNGLHTNAGIGNALVRLTNCTVGVTYGTSLTDGGGNYTFDVPGGATNLCVELNPIANLVPTGASTNGTTVTNGTCAPPPGSGANYIRSSGWSSNATLCFVNVAGTGYANLNLGVVPQNTFVADNTENTQPGVPVFYAHTFTPGSVGTVTFTVPTQVTQPVSTFWSTLLYRDSNCNGVLDGTEGNAVLSAAQPMDPNDATVGEPSQRRVCLIAKVTPPPAAPFNAEHIATVQAAFTYTGAAAPPSANYTRQDITRIGEKGAGLDLRKEVCNTTASSCNATTGAGFGLNNSGRPGEVLQYRIRYTNNSSAPLTNLVINDTSPPFTVRGTNPAAYLVTPTPALTTGVITQPAIGASGAFAWTFGGSLNPQATGIVTFEVTIQ